MQSSVKNSLDTEHRKEIISSNLTIAAYSLIAVGIGDESAIHRVLKAFELIQQRIDRPDQKRD